MYIDNEKISRRQMKRLMVFNVFSISALMIPRIVVANAGRDGLISIIIGLFLALLFIIFIGFISKHMSGNFMEYTKKKCGSIIAYIVGAFYIIKYFACLVLCGRLFAEVIEETLLEDTDVRLIILLLLILSAYSASKGFEVRARITEILYFIVLIPSSILLVFGLASIDLANLLPLLTESTSEIIYGGYLVFITFTTLEFLLFSSYNIQDKAVKSPPEHKYNSKQEKAFKLFKDSNLNYILNALAIVGIIDILLYVVTVGILGVNDTRRKLWSTVNMIQIVDMPGGFLERHDALMISIWMLSIFTLTSGFLYYMLTISKDMYNLKSKNYMILPFILLLFAACSIPLDIEVYFWYFEKYMTFIAMPGSIIIPLIIVIIGKIRDYTQMAKNNMKIGKERGKSVSRLSLLALIILMSLLTACSDMTEIEDRNFIQALGLDYQDGQISLSLESPDLPAYTDQGSSQAEEKEKLIKVMTGNDFYQIEEDYINEGNKRIDFSHLQVIVFGRGLLENKETYYEFLSYVENRYEISRNTLIFMSDASAEDIMNMNGKVEKGIGNHLHQLYLINVNNKGREKVKLQDLLLSKNESNLVAKTPIIALEDESVVVNGNGFIKDGILAYETGKDENEYINMAKGYGDSSRFFIEDESGNVKYSLKINKIDQTIEFDQVDNKPFMVLRIDGDGELERGLEKLGNRLDASYKENLEQINFECNAYMEYRIGALIEEISKENHVDFLNLYRRTYGHKDLWLDYKDKNDEFLDDLDYTVEVRLGL